MKIAFFSTKPYDIEAFGQASSDYGYQIDFYECRLNQASAKLAAGSKVVCAFVNDDLSKACLEELAKLGIQLITLRCAGFNNVDLEAAAKLGIKVTRVPAYSPHAVAEHCFALILTLNRKTHKAYNRTREANFSINGLMGFDLVDKTIGLIGCGEIGSVVAQIARGFGMKVLIYDPYITDSNYDLVDLKTLLQNSNIISLHCPLNQETKHIINEANIKLMQDSVMLINTSRGATIDSKAVIQALKSKKIAYLGLDVYEEESNYFFEDHSTDIIEDETLSRLLSFPNVLISSHQAFFTHEAINQIVKTSLGNIKAHLENKTLINEVKL